MATLGAARRSALAALAALSLSLPPTLPPSTVAPGAAEGVRLVEYTRKLVQSEGAAALYRGLTPSLISATRTSPRGELS